MRLRQAIGAMALALLTALALAMPTPALAATTTSVVASAPEAGETVAPASGRYWVQFANNVAAVEGNAGCVTLRTADGQQVPADAYQVSLPDVELEFGFRQYIWIDVAGLEAGADYVIHISGDITAKNGSTLGQDVDIPFTVAGQGETATALPDPSQTAAGSGNGDGSGGGAASSSGESASDQGNSSADSASQASDDSAAQVVDLTPQQQSAAQQPLPLQVAAILLAMAAAVVVALIVRIRKAGRS